MLSNSFEIITYNCDYIHFLIFENVCFAIRISRKIFYDQSCGLFWPIIKHTVQYFFKIILITIFSFNLFL